MINRLYVLAVIMLSWIGALCSHAADTDKVVVAYVTSWSDIIPDPGYMSHINYAFGHVNKTFDGIEISNPGRLEKIAALKKAAPGLNVLLSVGGWGSGGFSEMAADPALRKAFAKDCARVVKEYNLDGIDIDWEYPTSDAAGISASPDDTKNFTLLMKDIRKAIGKKKQLTLATICTGQFIDFPAIMPYVDFVNIMSYDMGGGGKHHSTLYRSDISGSCTADEAVKAHLKAGVPAEKLVMGLPFYGRGIKNEFRDYAKIQIPDSCAEQWDNVAKAPYIADRDGNFVFGYDNARSLSMKCDYIAANGLKGAMYWDYAGDDSRNSLRTTVADKILKNADLPHVTVLNEGGGQHGPFSKAAMNWLCDKATEKGFTITEISDMRNVGGDFLKDTDLVIQLDYPPYTWTDDAQNAFIDYIENGKGAWIGFHHATLLGDFDGFPLWKWFSDFMGGITFSNYVAKLADGIVDTEDPQHPVMKGVEPRFILNDDEWYTYDKSPRNGVHVLASVDENSYTPSSDIRMGDHPVIWTNDSMKARNVYFQFGHSPRLFNSDNFVTLFDNALDWGLNRSKTK